MKKEYLIVFILFFGWNTLYAADKVKIGDLYYYLNSSTKKTASVTSPSSGKYSGDIVIPSSVTYEGITYNVIEIWDAFWGCTGLTSITIPNSVKSISGAFYGCGGLTSIVVESGNTVYDSRENCNAIIETATNTLIRGCNTTVIPNSVTSIGEGAFSGCTGLTSITIPESVTSIGSSAFYGCTGLTSVTIPENVTNIGYGAFSGCTSLTSIVVESSNTVYDSRENCNAIIETATNTLIQGCNTTVIPNSVTSIGDRAFCCTGLTSVTIPNSVTSIGEYAFYGCTGLTSVTIPNSVTSIENCTFSSSGLTSITIPNSVTSIGEKAFYDCTGLTSVTIGKNVTSIGKYAFSGCINLTSAVWNAKHCDCTSLFYDAMTNMESFTFGNEVDSIPAYLCYRMSKLTSITIPKSVTWIGDCAFNGCTGLTSVVWNAKKCGWSSSPFSQSIDSITSFTFGNEVDSIPAYLCYRMSKLTSITIPNSVMSIGDYAFQYCTGLTSVTIGKNVTSIGKYAFSGCTGLTSVVWNAKKCGGWSGYSSSPFYAASNKITSFTFGNEVDSIPNYLCYDMSKLTSITIPNSVTNIGDGVFWNCNSLDSINIPNSVTSIGEYAFYGCTGLTSITVPNSVTSIENCTFYRCTGLTSITIPNSVTSIGTDAFYGCTGLKKVNYTGDVKGWLSIDMSMSDNPIHYSRNLYINDVLLTDLVIPDRVTEVSAAFAYDTCITSVTIPNSVTSIGEKAFYDCTGLTSVTIPNSVTNIGSRAFSSSGLTSIAIPNSVTTIGDSAFYRCSSLTSITIPNSVTSIGTDAFYGCTGLKKVNYTGDVKGWLSIDMSMSDNPIHYSRNLYINDVLLTDLVIPDRVTEVSAAFAYDTCITSVTIPNSVTSIGKSAFYGCTGLTSVTIPNSVTNIGSNAFYRCTGLTSITIPNSVTSIGVQAFWGCRGLTSVTIPNSVTSIGSGTFWGCTGLTSVTIGNSVTSIGNSTFYGCTGLTSVTIGNSVTSIGVQAFWGCTGLTSITIPNSVTSIGKYAFYGCTGLTSITVPNSVTSIENCTFYRCTGLISITIPNSVTSIGGHAFDGCTGLTSIRVESQTPPQCGYSCFSCCPNDIPLYIPCGTKEAYQADAVWSSFTNIIEEHEYSAIIQPSANGAVETVAYTCDNELTIQATANEHYHFTQWNDGNTDNPRTFVVFQDTTLTAEFAIDQHTISAQTEHGHIEGTGEHDYGTSITLTAIADEHYHFTQWGDGNTDNPRTVVVEGDATYAAEFAIDQFTITATAEGNGSVSGDGTYDYGVEVILYAIADEHYHFTQWSDGNTDNPRTVLVEGEATYTAEFALAYSGQCGDNLYWSYANHTLTISGTGAMYDYDESNLPWLLLRDTITAVVLERGITHIGNNAFNNFAKLNKIELPNTLTSIGASAFACCRKLYDIYSYAIEPPVADNSSFTNYNVYLYVLCDNLRDYQMDVVFGSFKYIKCMGADEVETINEVTVDASANDAVFTWPADGSAASYTLQITKDGEVFCTLVFNSFGQLTGIAFAPSPDGTAPANRAAESTNSGYRFTVTGLDEASTYTYDLTVKDADDKVVHNYTGTFATEGATALAPVEIAGLYATAGRIICDGEFQIFDLLGRNVTRLNGSLNGVYVVKLGDRAQKIVVR